MKRLLLTLSLLFLLCTAVSAEELSFSLPCAEQPAADRLPWRWDWTQNLYLPDTSRGGITVSVWLRRHGSPVWDLWRWYSGYRPQSSSGGFVFADDLHFLPAEKKILPDEGIPAWKTIMPPARFKKEFVPRYEPQTPSGSRADVTASVQWKNGVLNVKFLRPANTYHADDLPLDGAVLVLPTLSPEIPAENDSRWRPLSDFMGRKPQK